MGTSDSDFDTSSSTSSCSCKSTDCPSTQSKDSQIYHKPPNFSNAVNLPQSNLDVDENQYIPDNHNEHSGISKRKHPLIEDITENISCSKTPCLLNHNENQGSKKSKSEG